MLEPLRSTGGSSALIGHFDDLDRAHQAVLKAKEQMEAAGRPWSTTATGTPELERGGRTPPRGCQKRCSRCLPRSKARCWTTSREAVDQELSGWHCTHRARSEQEEPDQRTPTGMSCCEPDCG